MCLFCALVKAQLSWVKMHGQQTAAMHMTLLVSNATLGQVLDLTYVCTFPAQPTHIIHKHTNTHTGCMSHSMLSARMLPAQAPHTLPQTTASQSSTNSPPSRPALWPHCTKYVYKPRPIALVIHRLAHIYNSLCSHLCQGIWAPLGPHRAIHTRAHPQKINFDAGLGGS